MKIDNYIKGTIYGMALGDAMGMPMELWGQEKTKAFFGKVNDLLAGPQTNPIACNYQKGQFTDDTKQALIILDSLNQTNFQPNYHIIVRNMLKWIKAIDGFNKDVLGPTSKNVFQAYQDHKPLPEVVKTTITNGSAMRIAPIGCLFEADNLAELTKYIFHISKFSHQSDIGIAGAAIIGAAVNVALYYKDFDKIINDALSVETQARKLGFATFAALISKRVKIGITIAKKFAHNESKFLKELYETIGSGMAMIEAVPAALSVAYYAQDPNKAALLCANLGGDTDTIGAMAGAICGAYSGFEKIKTKWVNQIKVSNEENLDDYVNVIKKGREILWKS